MTKAPLRFSIIDKIVFPISNGGQLEIHMDKETLASVSLHIQKLNHDVS